MRERDDRHAAQRREVLVGAAERLPEHDGTDTEAGDGGGREGRQRGDAGSGLRGYGKLVIIKHNATYLTAYAHNRDILVKEGQNVTRGQKIAEMGNTDADRVKLHFEIRRLGKPMDPLRFLPPA